MHRYAICMYRIVNTSTGPINGATAISTLRYDDDIGMVDIEVVVHDYLELIKGTDTDNPTAVDARKSGIEWYSFTDMTPSCGLIIAAGLTSGSKEPFIMIVREI